MAGTDLRLDNLITSIGTRRFEGVLMDVGAELVGMDHCILIYFPQHKTKPSTLFSAGKIADSLAQDCADLYDGELFHYDPILEKVRRSEGDSQPTIVQSRIDDFQNQQYRDTLLSRCEIAEKVSLLSCKEETGYCLNFYRLFSSDSYQPKTISRLQSVSRIIDSVVHKHIDLLSKLPCHFNLDWVFDRLSSCCADVLTRRELEVCARIVVGYTSEAIGLNLNISINTVLTHRKNAYEKLGIGTQNQLFAIVVEGLPKRKLH